MITYNYGLYRLQHYMLTTKMIDAITLYYTAKKTESRQFTM